jgi:hypothetical protein
MLTRSGALVALSLLSLTAAGCRTLPPPPPPLPPGSLSQAATPEPPPAPDEWQFGIAPYVWAAGLDGSLKVKGADVDVNMSFGDILDDLNYSLQGLIEARKGGWTWLLDNTYMSLTADGELRPGPGPGISMEADVALLISQLDLLHDLWEGSPYALGGGVRYLNPREDVHVGGLATLRDEDSITDGVVAGRALWPLDERWSFLLYADAGAGDSDFTWQTAASFHYAFDGWSLGFGYRVLDYDVGGSNDVDVTLSGLTMGVDFRF